jgi:hypothetical protein
MPESLFGQFITLLVTVGSQLGLFLLALGQALLPLLPVLLWCAWWLWAVNWKKAWPVLAAGAWVPVVLLVFLVSLAWSRVSREACDCLGFVTISTFWWRLGVVGGLTALALFCGWLQGVLGWTPREVSFDPPAPTQGHGHHGH